MKVPAVFNNKAKKKIQQSFWSVQLVNQNYSTFLSKTIAVVWCFSFIFLA